MNARGILTVAYQVLLGGVPPPVGVPPARSARGAAKVGYPPHQGTPARSDRGHYLRWGTPHQGIPPPGTMGDI